MMQEVKRALKTYDDGFEVREMTLVEAKTALDWSPDGANYICYHDVEVCMAATSEASTPAYFAGIYRGELVASFIAPVWGSVTFGSSARVRDDQKGHGFGTRVFSTACSFLDESNVFCMNVTDDGYRMVQRARVQFAAPNFKTVYYRGVAKNGKANVELMVISERYPCSKTTQLHTIMYFCTFHVRFSSLLPLFSRRLKTCR